MVQGVVRDSTSTCPWRLPLSAPSLAWIEANPSLAKLLPSENSLGGVLLLRRSERIGAGIALSSDTGYLFPILLCL
jgi:hypothetical protein